MWGIPGGMYTTVPGPTSCTSPPTVAPHPPFSEQTAAYPSSWQWSRCTPPGRILASGAIILPPEIFSSNSILILS